MSSIKQNITKIVSIAIILTGIISLGSYFLHYNPILSAYGILKFNTVLSFIFCGIALYFLNKPGITKKEQLISDVLSIIIFLIGAFTLIQYLLNINLGIDEIFWKSGKLNDPDFPGRMSWISAFNFSLFGIAFYFFRRKHNHIIVPVCVFIVIPGLLQVLFNYSFGAQVLKFIPRFSEMSLLSAIIYVLLIIGAIFSSPLESLKIDFHKKIISIFILIISVLVLIFYAIAESNRNFYDTIHQGQKTQKALQIKNKTFDLAREIETNTMRYLITGRATSLAKYNKASGQILENIRQLRELSNNSHSHYINFDSLEELVSANLKIRNEIISVRKSKGYEEAVKLFDEVDTKALMDNLINLLASFEDGEYRQLAKENIRNEQTITNTSRIINVFQLIIAISLIIVLFIIYKNTRLKNKALLSLKKSEQFIRTIINSINNPVSVRDTSGKFLMVNNFIEKTLKTSSDKIIGKHIGDFFPKQIADGFIKEDEEVIVDKKFKVSEQILTMEDGLHHFINTRFPLFDEKDNVYAVGTVSTDITYIKQAQESLQKSNSQLQQVMNGIQRLMETSLDVICLFDEDGCFISVSSTCENLWGYTSEELIGKKYIDFVHNEDILATQKVEAELLNGGSVYDFENRYKRKDGSWVTVVWTSIWSADDRQIYAIAKDGTEKKMTLENLQKSRKLLVQAEEIAHVGSWELDLISNKYEWSDEFYRICGFEPGSVIPDSETKFNIIHPDDREQARIELARAIETGGTYKLKKRIHHQDGTIRTILSQGHCILNKLGNPIKVIGIYLDITEREENERILLQINKQLEEKAIELQETNAELERFAFAASHDIQEPMRMVSSFMSLLERELQGKLNDTTKEYFQFAIEGTERMQEMIKNLLNYSRFGYEKEASLMIDCNEVLQKVKSLLILEIQEKNADLITHPLPVIKAAQTKILQLFQNLIGNALKYNNKSLPQIEVGCTDQGDKWQFYVKDNGIGIEPKFLDKVFIIFQRLHTQEKFSGSGIGLSLCKKIVENMGGKIWVQSELNNGSTFYFTLPKHVK